MPRGGLRTSADDVTVVSTLKSEITQYAGVDAANVPIVATETNDAIANDTQPGALFAADMYMSWLENGGTNGSGVTEPPLDTPFASYYGVQMLTKLAAPGDQMVNASSGTATLTWSTAATLNISGLTIGASYTYDVVAVNTHGNPSLASSPVTSTVPPPAALYINGAVCSNN